MRDFVLDYLLIAASAACVAFLAVIATIMVTVSPDKPFCERWAPVYDIPSNNGSGGGGAAPASRKGPRLPMIHVQSDRLMHSGCLREGRWACVVT